MVVPTPYQQGTELDFREKRQLGFKEPWRVCASSLVMWAWHPKTQMPSLWLKSRVACLEGGRPGPCQAWEVLTQAVAL